MSIIMITIARVILITITHVTIRILVIIIGIVIIWAGYWYNVRKRPLSVARTVMDELPAS